MSTLTIQRVGHACGARVSGVDLSKPISAADLEAIRRAWLENLVLVFPGQKLDPRSLVAFTRNFGELDDYATQPFNRHPEFKEVFVLTNKRTNGKPSPTYNSGQNWHTDLSYTLRPAKGTAVYCVEKPAVGGDTMFANMYLAYEALSPGMQRILAGLRAVNSSRKADVTRTREDRMRDSGGRADARKSYEAEHPVVRTHPETGRKALYVNVAHTMRFAGMTEEESAPLLEYLFRHQVRPEFTCRFRWRPGSLAFWDNRCVQHYPINDYHGHRRLMHRITLAGERPY